MPEVTKYVDPVVELMERYGHLVKPFNGPARDLGNVANATRDDNFVKDAVRSYQTMYSGTLEPLIAKHHPHRDSAVVNPDGDIGPATAELFTISRCGNPDYAVAEALGRGSWKNCHGANDIHRVLISVRTKPPSFLEPLFEQVMESVYDAYAQIGLEIIRDDKSTSPNIEIFFQKPTGGWIGLAQVPDRPQSCSSQIWARFDWGYKPANLFNEWRTLIMHEIAHNCGLSHTNGGVMNPFIVKGLLGTWIGDPSHPFLVANFGGVAIHRDGAKDYKFVYAKKWLKTNRYEDIYDVPEKEGPFPS